MKAATLPMALVAACMLTLPGCSNKQEIMEAQLLQHDAQLKRIQPVQADSWNQVQALRQEVNELKGLVADLRKVGGAAAMVDKLDRHDQALRQIETRMAMSFDLGDPITAAQAAPAADPAAGAQAAPAAPATDAARPVSLSQASAQPALAAPAAAPAATAAASGIPTGDTWGQETPRAQAAKAQKDMTVALFDAGVTAFKARNYESAQRSFSDFLKDFSSDPKAPSAQYYLAECHFQQNRFPEAALAYDTVITKYPKSSSAPGAYLKQGICFSKMKQTSAARQRMQELIKKYPNSPEAARARNFLKTNK